MPETSGPVSRRAPLTPPESERVRWLRSPQAVRERCQRILELGRAGKLHAFEVHEDRLTDAAALVVEVTRAAYPSLAIPLHARWRHFDVGGVGRVAALERALASTPVAERVAAKLDLAVTSVLLDAGAGPAWRYREVASGKSFARSEGLAVASYRMFMEGAFSSDPARPYRADADGLAAFDEGKLARGFQVTGENPLVGLEGRAALVRALGTAVRKHPDLFSAVVPRPGGLAGAWGGRREIGAAELLAAVLRGFGAIWPGRVELDGENLGDVWSHDGLGPAGSFESLVPFHKLSQWLTYSLVEPLEEGGLKVKDLGDLTGLPEYRNGGLFLDTGVLSLKDPADAGRSHAPGSPLIVEWRALTVALLDAVAVPVRHALGLDEASFPLAKVLEGGTWAAGRRIAAEKRPGGPPPLALESDGTVF